MLQSHLIIILDTANKLVDIFVHFMYEQLEFFRFVLHFIPIRCMQIWYVQLANYKYCYNTK